MHAMSQLFVTKFRRSMHAVLRTISVFKELKKLKRNQAVKFKFWMQI